MHSRSDSLPVEVCSSPQDIARSAPSLYSRNGMSTPPSMASLSPPSLPSSPPPYLLGLSPKDSPKFGRFSPLMHLRKDSDASGSFKEQPTHSRSASCSSDTSEHNRDTKSESDARRCDMDAYTPEELQYSRLKRLSKSTSSQLEVMKGKNDRTMSVVAKPHHHALDIVSAPTRKISMPSWQLPRGNERESVTKVRRHFSLFLSARTCIYKQLCTMVSYVKDVV